MQCHVKACLAAAVCLLSASASAQQAPEAAIQQVTVSWQKNASKWFRAESQHFVVVSDTSSDDVTRLLDNLERLDYLLRVYTKGYDKNSALGERKTTLYYAARIEDLNRLGLGQPAEAVGLYNSCAAGVQGFAVQLEPLTDVPDASLPTHLLNESLSHVFEAYARHFLYQHTDIRAPLWFIDGFAQYFSAVRFSDAQLIVGRTPLPLGRYLDFLQNGRRYSLDYGDVLAGNDAKGQNYAGAAGVKLEFEARAWILAHYVLSSEDRRRKLGAYLKAFYDGVPSGKAFEQTFGISPAELSTAMWRYRLQAAKAVRAEQQALPRAVVNFASMPESAGDFVLADALLKSCPARADGEALLTKLRTEAAKVPQAEVAQLTLSRAEIDWGDPAAALPWLERALRKNEANAALHALAGRAHLRLAQQAEGSERQAQVEAARRSLARARELDPAAPDVALASLRADVLDKGEPSAATLDAVIAAWRRARDVDALTRTAALAYAWRGDGISAANLLRSMVSNARDPDVAAWAAQWKKRLDAGLTLAELKDGLRRDAWSGSTFRDWTVDQGSVMADVQANAGREDVQPFLNQSPDVVTGAPTPMVPLRGK